MIRALFASALFAGLIWAGSVTFAGDPQPVAKSSEQDAPTEAAPTAAKPEKEVFAHIDSVCVSDQHLIEDLRSREKKLEDERLSLASKEAELLARETALNEQIKKLDDLRQQIAGLEATRDSKQAEQVGKLVQTVEHMSPKAAAGLIERLDERLAVSAMAQIETGRLAKIMNVLSADKSSRLSEILATGKVQHRDPAAAPAAPADGKGTKG